jgi:hypothetical protein
MLHFSEIKSIKMKRSILFDVLFIFLAGGIILAFTETGNANIISRYIIIFILAAYFSGKFVASKK